MPTVRQGVGEIADIPLIISLLFKKFDVHIGNGHGETIIETDTSQLVGETQGRHPRHVFGYGDALGVKFV